MYSFEPDEEQQGDFHGQRGCIGQDIRRSARQGFPNEGRDHEISECCRSDKEEQEQDTRSRFPAPGNAGCQPSRFVFRDYLAGKWDRHCRNPGGTLAGQLRH